MNLNNQKQESAWKNPWGVLWTNDDAENCTAKRSARKHKAAAQTDETTLFVTKHVHTYAVNQLLVNK